MSQSFGAALWWSITTITTVGYGDTFPVTTAGRFIAASLMFAGIAVLGVVTASFASWLIERVTEIEEDSQESVEDEIRALSAEVRRLAQLLEEPHEGR